MRRASVLAVALTLAPLPAAADVTARYELGTEQLSVEVAESGDYRAEVSGKFAVMRRNGAVHLVLYVTATPLVIERQTFLDLAKTTLADKLPKPGGAAKKMTLTKGADEEIAGRRGTLWTLAAPAPAGKPVELVLTSDAELAPVGAVFAEVVDTALQVFGAIASDTDFAERARELLAKGTPLRIKVGEEIRLRSASTAPIDAARFVLPGPVADAATLERSLSAPLPSPDSEPAPLPPLP